MEENEKKEDENFTKFREDIEGKKQTVLFIGAGVNYTKDRKMMWPDLLNYLMDYAKGRLDVSSYEREIIIKALMEGKEDKEDNLKLKMKACKMFPSEVKASIIKQLLGDANCRIFKMDPINLFVPKLDDTMRFNFRKEDGMIVFDVDTPTEISTMKDYWRKTVNAALI